MDLVWVPKECAGAQAQAGRLTVHAVPWSRGWYYSVVDERGKTLAFEYVASEHAAKRGAAAAVERLARVGRITGDSLG